LITIKQTGRTSAKTLISVSRLLIFSSENADCDPGAAVDINMVWRHWRDKLMDAAVQHIPTKVVKRRNTPPWLDSKTCHLFKKKETV
jgi:hypothetical protein